MPTASVPPRANYANVERLFNREKLASDTCLKCETSELSSYRLADKQKKMKDPRSSSRDRAKIGRRKKFEKSGISLGREFLLSALSSVKLIFVGNR